MRPDQIARLEKLAEDVAEEFLREADPANWSGAGQNPAEMDRETRGARNWDVKNANQVGALTVRVMELLNKGKNGDQYHPDDQTDPEEEVKHYERKAREMMEAVMGRRVR